MNEQIITAIEKTRKQMIECIQKNGCANQNTVSLSQKLDLLIVEYQKSAINGSR